MSVTRLRHRGCWPEAAAILAPAAEHDAGAAVELTSVLVEQCLFAGVGWDDAEAAAGHARDLARTDTDRAAALGEHGHLAYAATLFGVADRADEAGSLLDESAALAVEGTVGWARSQFRRGLVTENLREEPAAARECYRRADEVAASAGDALLRSYTARHLAGADQADGDLEAAERGYRESLRLRLECGFTVGVAPALVALAGVCRPAEAELLRAQAAVLVRALGGIPVWLRSVDVEGGAPALTG